MQSTRHDGDLAALHASSLPGYVLDVVVLTSDGGLLATLREASSPEHAIWHAPSADAAVDYLVGGRCGILVADLGTLRAEAASLLARLHAQFPELVIMATGRRDEEAAVASLVGDGRIYRFLHKPISPARANLFLGAATRRYAELRNAEPIVLTTVRTIARRPRTMAIAGTIVALIAITAGLAWFFAGSTQTEERPDPTALSAERTQGQIEELLARANMALATGRLVEPRGDNALELYRDVLELAPNHSEAAAGERRIIAALEADVTAALQAHDPQAGAAALAKLADAAPDHPRYEQFYRELIELSRSQTTSQPPVAVSRTAPAQPRSSASTPPPKAASDEASAPPASAAPVETSQEPLEKAEQQIEEAVARSEVGGAVEEQQTPAAASGADALEDALEKLALATRLRERGLLIEPSDNNAFDALASIREEHPDLAEIADEQRRLADALIDHARTLLAASDLEAAPHYLDKAAELEPASPVVRSLRAQLQAALAEREARRVISAGGLKRTREFSPEYPYDAQRRRIEGWVDVEFTIATDGATRDVIVRQSEPKDIFDRATLDAIRRWRFEPIVRNGQPVEQRAMLRIEYKLE